MPVKCVGAAAAKATTECLSSFIKSLFLILCLTHTQHYVNHDKWELSVCVFVCVWVCAQLTKYLCMNQDKIGSLTYKAYVKLTYSTWHHASVNRPAAVLPKLASLPELIHAESTVMKTMKSSNWLNVSTSYTWNVVVVLHSLILPT